MFVEKSSRRAIVINRLFLLSLISLTTGCAGQFNNWLHNGFKVGPDYMKPAAQVADEYAEVADPQITDAPPDCNEWWTVFNDPVLNQLIAIASQQGISDAAGSASIQGLPTDSGGQGSLREAALRILQAREALGYTTWNLAPGNGTPLAGPTSSGGGGGAGHLGQQEAFFDYQRRQSSKQTFPTNLRPGIFLPKRSFSTWDLGLRAAWEIDIWGKFRRAIEAGRADLDFTIEEYDALLVSVLADVTQTYYRIRTLQQGLYYTQQNVEAQKNALKLAEVKFKGEVTSELDPQQARTLLKTTQALVPEIEKEIRQQKNLLCYILGLPPHNIDGLLGDAQASNENSLIPAVPAQVAVGIPADLLRRRPDLRALERQVAAESARIGIRASDLFPSVSLFGTIQYEAESIKDLFGGKAVAGTLGAPSIRWPILHYGRIRANINIQDAIFQEAAARYERAVLQANREVADAIVGFLKVQEQAAFLKESVIAAKRSVEIAEVQYRAGASDPNRFFTLQADKARLDNELARAQGEAVQELIRIYRRLGGGWEIRLNPPPIVHYPEAIEPPAPENGQPLPPALPDALVPQNGVPQAPAPMPGNGAAQPPMPMPEDATPQPPMSDPSPDPGNVNPNNGDPASTMMRFLPPQPAHQDAHAWKFSGPAAVVPVGHWEMQMPLPQR